MYKIRWITGVVMCIDRSFSTNDLLHPVVIFSTVFFMCEPTTQWTMEARKNSRFRLFFFPRSDVNNKEQMCMWFILFSIQMKKKIPEFFFLKLCLVLFHSFFSQVCHTTNSPPIFFLFLPTETEWTHTRTFLKNARDYGLKCVISHQKCFLRYITDSLLQTEQMYVNGNCSMHEICCFYSYRHGKMLRVWWYVC